ncbi:hypothetical protein SBA5_760010 [Candidatus Sulfotelmatomonas gaucii]|uniref:DUF2442 domain-containing protein n=1 Tax=Candidatus Sulfuritelmatomonas gaucii TaxID=2043161 RepID=A0A2N9M458_9BACT|nr:hypothetical protein SBA5_760010 [Candidatus Sulfotelmatomonas gaucii]
MIAYKIACRLRPKPATVLPSTARRRARFAAFRSLEYGAVTWPGELDLAPDAMHAAILEQGEWSL